MQPGYMIWNLDGSGTGREHVPIKLFTKLASQASHVFFF